jgi:hypothetical protein
MQLRQERTGHAIATFRLWREHEWDLEIHGRN